MKSLVWAVCALLVVLQLGVLLPANIYFAVNGEALNAAMIPVNIVFAAVSLLTLKGLRS